MEKFYITTAIPYASKIPHIGNTYEAVLTDAIARYKKLRGYDVYFCTGTDEHGLKVEQVAAEEGVTPKEHADKISTEIRHIWQMMGVDYDYFIRTTDADHEARVMKIFNKLYDKGDIYKKNYEGWYCTPCESFFTDSQIVEKEGEYFCPDCGAKLQKAKEDAYFFRLSNYGPRLLEYIEKNPDFITPASRRNEMVNNFLKPGLQDICVTRSTFTWGVKVPFDPKHVVYVWIDALANYITALGYNPDGESEDNFKKYWPADLHVIGKDIVRFHTLFWPGMLMALGLELPKQVLGHPWMLFGNDKMSKSKGNVIYAEELVDFFGKDAIRYYLLSEMSYNSDSSITYELVIDKINTDLANILGNLVNRTVAMINRYFDGKLPLREGITDLDQAFIDDIEKSKLRYTELMDEYRLADACGEIIDILKRSNKYIDETAPWTLAKDEAQKGRLASVLYNLVEAIRISAVLLIPIFPDTAERIFNQIGAYKKDWDSITLFDFENDVEVAKAEPLFARIDREAKLAEVKAYYDAHKKKPLIYEEQAAEITIDDFMKIDLRAAEVLECEKIKKSDKLLKFKLNLGYEERTVVSGIAQWYKPEELVGKTVMVVANLKPAVLRGVESKGMIISADNVREEGQPEDVILLAVDGKVKPGSRFH